MEKLDSSEFRKKRTQFSRLIDHWKILFLKMSKFTQYWDEDFRLIGKPQESYQNAQPVPTGVLTCNNVTW